MFSILYPALKLPVMHEVSLEPPQSQHRIDRDSSPRSKKQSILPEPWMMLTEFLELMVRKEFGEIEDRYLGALVWEGDKVW